MNDGSVLVGTYDLTLRNRNGTIAKLASNGGTPGSFDLQAAQKNLAAARAAQAAIDAAARAALDAAWAALYGGGLTDVAATDPTILSSTDGIAVDGSLDSTQTDALSSDSTSDPLNGGGVAVTSIDTAQSTDALKLKADDSLLGTAATTVFQ